MFKGIQKKKCWYDVHKWIDDVKVEQFRNLNYYLRLKQQIVFFFKVIMYQPTNADIVL